MSKMTEIDEYMKLLSAIIQQEGHQEKVKFTLMAKDMKPDRFSWEKLGFKFVDIDGDLVLCKALLPQGWKVVPTDYSAWSEVLDENENVRGQMFYNSTSYDKRVAYMNLLPRYYVCSLPSEDDSSVIEIYFGNLKEKIFVAGTVNRKEYFSNEDLLEMMDEEDRLKEIAKQFADENYPNWKSSLAYWDIEMDDTKGSIGR